MTVHFQTYGFKKSAANMKKLGDDMVYKLAEPLNDIIDDMAEVEETLFNSQGRRGGGMWKRPTVRWRRRKRNKGLDARTMHATKRLRKSLTYRGNKEMIDDVDALAGVIRFGTRVPYARLLSKGSTPTGGGFFIKGGTSKEPMRAGAWKQMPARPIFKFTMFDRRRWAKIINKFVIGEYKRRIRMTARKRER